MTWNDQAYFAPEALIDDKGRQIMWAWVFDDRPENVQSAGGWTGTYGLPRSLWLGGDGSLRISPVKELENLRLTEKAESNFLVKDNVEMVRNDLGFELLELELVIAPGGGNIFGVKVCRSANGEEETVISYDRESKKLLVDTRNSGTGFGRKILEEAPLDIPAGEALVLRIFVDRSIVEVFANDKQAVARAVYPAPGSKGVSFFSTGGDSHVISLKSWELMPANAY